MSIGLPSYVLRREVAQDVQDQLESIGAVEPQPDLRQIRADTNDEVVLKLALLTVDLTGGDHIWITAQHLKPDDRT